MIRPTLKVIIFAFYVFNRKSHKFQQTQQNEHALTLFKK